MRTRTKARLDLDRADRLAAGEPAGAELRGLDDLLRAAKAPATAAELAGEQAAVAAFRAAREQATKGDHRAPAPRPAVARPTRRILVSVAAGLALAVTGGTAVAARTGHLPTEAQQRAHEIFSGLGVPAPTDRPAPPRERPTTSATPRTPTPTPSPSPAATPTRSIAPTNDSSPAGWCKAWKDGDTNAAVRRKLIAAAGGADRVDAYCARLTATASVSPSATTKPHGKPSKSHPGKKK